MPCVITVSSSGRNRELETRINDYGLPEVSQHGNEGGSTVARDSRSRPGVSLYWMVFCWTPEPMETGWITHRSIPVALEADAENSKMKPLRQLGCPKCGKQTHPHDCRPTFRAKAYYRKCGAAVKALEESRAKDETKP